MTRHSAGTIVPLASGALFGAGLVLGGMTDPKNVLAFLDVAGDWSPRLLYVMVAAVAVHAPVQLWMRGRAAPLAAHRFHVPARSDIDARLWVGAMVFGVGWGASGYCPGPSVVALPSAQAGVLAFFGAMVLGMWLTSKLEQAPQLRAAASAADGGASR